MISKKYETIDINYDGCHPVIAEALKNNKAILCKVMDNKSPCYIDYYDPTDCLVKYRSPGGAWHIDAEPVVKTVKRIMPPERAIPTLITEGWKFNASGQMTGPAQTIVPKMLCCLGRPLDDPNTISWGWPSCIIEEVEDDE